MLLALSNRLGTVPRRYFVKNIYQEINYEAPFSGEEKSRLLSVLNEASSSDNLNQLGVNKVYAKRIFKHVQDHGPFESLEQLLDVKSMDPAILERVSKNVLQSQQKRTGEEGEDFASCRGLHKHVKPTLTASTWKGVNSVCGLKYSLDGLAYCQVDSERNVLAWDAIPMFKNHLAMHTFEHYKIFDMAKSVARQLPPSDLFVFEENYAVMPKDPYFKSKVNLLQFQSGLVSLLNGLQSGGEICEENRVYSSRMVLQNTLFDLTVGTERIILAQSKLEDIMGYKKFDQGPFGVTISEEVWKRYRECSVKQVKEQMSLALLTTLAIHHLMSRGIK